MLYPSDTLKQVWDIVISLLLLIAAFQTPIAIAFQLSSSADVFGYVIDSLFGLDILICFTSAYYD